MILPIYTYGQPVLKRVAEDIEVLDEMHEELIENMWDTMYNASGVGLAAPQVGHSKRIFIVDTLQLLEDQGTTPRYKIDGLKKVFINPSVVEMNGKLWSYEEGCLSIPQIRAEVERLETVTISYRDENFESVEETYDGIEARVILHEYDHLEGVLFVEKIKPLKRNLLRRKLEQMRRGKVVADYAIRPSKK